MPDRVQRTGERTDRKRIYSTVVVSKSFQKARDKRDSSKERRERRYRQRSPDDIRDSDRHEQKLHMDRDEVSRERRRQRLSERLGHRGRKSDGHEENEGKDDSTSRWKERNQRYTQGGRGPPLTNQQRRTVFDRLDSGPPRDRGFVRNLQGGGPRDQRTVEVEVNPQDVPRGKRYFMHDDRELPRRQKLDRSRARSRSPLWVHDRFDDNEEDQDQDQEQEEKAAQDDSQTTNRQDREIIQSQKRERDRRREDIRHN